MTYAELRQAEAEYRQAIETPKKQRGATKAQLAFRARLLTTPARNARCTCEDGLCDRHGWRR